jgi:hypothetical protein
VNDPIGRSPTLYILVTLGTGAPRFSDILFAIPGQATGLVNAIAGPPGELSIGAPPQVDREDRWWAPSIGGARRDLLAS